MLKRLQQRAEILMHGVGEAPAPEKTFLAYLEIVASNTTVRSLLCFLFIVPLVVQNRYIGLTLLILPFLDLLHGGMLSCP